MKAWTSPDGPGMEWVPTGQSLVAVLCGAHTGLSREAAAYQSADCPDISVLRRCIFLSRQGLSLE